MHFYPPQGFVCGYIWVNIGPTHFIRPKGMDWSEHDFVVNAKQQIQPNILMFKIKLRLLVGCIVMVCHKYIPALTDGEMLKLIENYMGTTRDMPNSIAAKSFLV